MDFFLELIINFFGEIIGEIIIDGSKESRIPKPLRIFLLILFLGIYLTLTGLCIFVAITANKVSIKILFAVLAIGFIAFIIRHAKK